MSTIIVGLLILSGSSENCATSKPKDFSTLIANSSELSFNTTSNILYLLEVLIPSPKETKYSVPVSLLAKVLWKKAKTPLLNLL